jgi:hypothetical protein
MFLFSKPHKRTGNVQDECDEVIKNLCMKRESETLENCSDTI